MGVPVVVGIMTDQRTELRETSSVLGFVEGQEPRQYAVGFHDMFRH